MSDKFLEIMLEDLDGMSYCELRLNDPNSVYAGQSDRIDVRHVRDVQKSSKIKIPIPESKVFGKEIKLYIKMENGNSFEHDIKLSDFIDGKMSFGSKVSLRDNEDIDLDKKAKQLLENLGIENPVARCEDCGDELTPMGGGRHAACNCKDQNQGLGSLF